MRYAFPLVLLAVMFAGAAATIVGTSSSYITISAKPESVKAGEMFTVTVSAYAHTPINAVDIAISFPETQTTIESIDTGGSVLSLWTREPYEENGVVHLTGGTFRKGFVGLHEIARIKVRATESGSALVTTDSVQLIAGDGKGTEVAVADTNTDNLHIYITNTDGSLVGEASVVIVTDVDGNGKVDLYDISMFMAAWFKGGGFFDFNGDGKMTFRDFSILLADSFFK